MPNIPVYQSQVRPRRPSGANAEAAARIGEIQQRTFQQLGQDVRDIGNMIDEQQGKQETSALTKDWALEEQSLTEDWNKVAAQADPNQIDKVADEWLEKTLQPRIDQFGAQASSTKGTALRDRLRAGMQERFFRVVAGDKAALAGQAVQSNLEETGNALANAARLDPSAMNEYIAGVRLSIEEQISSHNLTADQAARVRGTVGDLIYKNIAMAAALGSAQRDPAQARKDLAAGKFSPYLTAEQQREVINEIEQQERAVEIEKERKIAAERTARRDAGEAAESDWTSQMLLNPTKVDPKAIANDPRLDGTQKRVLSNFLEQQLKPEGGDNEGGGPGFWATYNRVMSNGPDRITDTEEIYRMVGPGKPLTLQGANQLATRLRARREGNKVGDFDAERQRSFFNEMHRLVTRDEYGSARLPIDGYDPEANYFRLYADKLRQIEEGQAKGKTLEQLLDYKSPDYIGKDWKSYVPPEPVDDFTPLPEEKPRTWMDFFGGLLTGSEKFSMSNFDKVTDGAQGIAALRAAVTAGATSKEEATAYALKRGWIRSGKEAPAVAPALK